MKKLFSEICVLTLIVFATNPVFEVEGMRGVAPGASVALARLQDQQQVRPVVVTGSIDKATGTVVITKADVKRCGAEDAVAVEIAAHVTEIEPGAFVSCIALERVTFAKHSQLRYIGYEAFQGCSQLREINIPERVAEIGIRAFDRCIALEKVTFAKHSQLRYIGYEAFQGCSYLRSFEIPENASHVGKKAFAGTPVVTSDAFKRIVLTAENIDKSSTEYVIPESVRIIAEGAFENCINLKAVTIGSLLTTIGAGTFVSCTNLESITNIPPAFNAYYIVYGCKQLRLLAFAANAYTESKYREKLFDIIDRSNGDDPTNPRYFFTEEEINAIVERSMQFARDKGLFKAE